MFYPGQAVFYKGQPYYVAGTPLIGDGGLQYALFSMRGVVRGVYESELTVATDADLSSPALAGH